MREKVTEKNQKEIPVFLISQGDAFQVPSDFWEKLKPENLKKRRESADFLNSQQSSIQKKIIRKEEKKTNGKL